jgi:hypothetical protein
MDQVDPSEHPPVPMAGVEVETGCSWGYSQRRWWRWKLSGSHSSVLVLIIVWDIC